MGDSELDSSKLEWNKKAAMEEVDHLKFLRSVSWEQHTHSFKWLTASLLALNGGALVTISGIDEIGYFDRIYSGLALALGILFALLVAVLGQRSIVASLLPIQRQIGYWMTVAEDGERLEDFEDTLNNEGKNALRLARVSQSLGWVSGLAFFVGLFFAGNSFWHHAPAQMSSNGQDMHVTESSSDRP